MLLEALIKDMGKCTINIKGIMIGYSIGNKDILSYI